MTPQDLQNLIAKLESKLARQTTALATTDAELKLVTNIDGLDKAIREALYIKRMRQHRAIATTQAYLKVLTSTTGVKTATK